MRARYPMKTRQGRHFTILTHMVADEFGFLWSQIQSYMAQADADLMPAQVNLNYMVDADVVSCCLHASGWDPQLQM